MEDYKICIAFIIGGFISSLIIESFILPKIIIFSRKKGLLDMPNDRKEHEIPVPRLGGISFFPVLLLITTIIFYIRLQMMENAYLPIFYNVIGDLMMIICGFLVLYIVGIKDDLSGVSYKKKFIVQIVAAIFMIASNTYIDNFYGLFGVYEIPIWIGIPLSMFLCIYITNSINLIDGIDGLASGLSSVALIVYGCLFFISEQWTLSIFCFTMLGILASFFYYNVFSTKNKIFMGDTGSLMLGFLLSFLGIRLAMDLPESSFAKPTGAILVAASVLIIPMFDTVKVMYARFRLHKNIFTPDRKHLHHRLIDIGFSHRTAMITIISSSIIITLTNLFALQHMDINIVFGADLIILLSSNGLISYQRNVKVQRITALARFPKKELQEN